MLSRTMIIIVMLAIAESTMGYHLQGWHHDLPEKKKKQPVNHGGLARLQAYSGALARGVPQTAVALPPAYDGRAVVSEDHVHSEKGRHGFTRDDLFTNQHLGNEYHHKGYDRGATDIEKAQSALITGPLSQGSKAESFRVKADSGSRVSRGVQRLDEAERDYESELNRDYSKSRISQLTDLGILDPAQAGIMMSWKHDGIDNVAVKSNQKSATNRAKGQTVDVVNDREYGAGNEGAARIVA